MKAFETENLMSMFKSLVVHTHTYRVHDGNELQNNSKFLHTGWPISKCAIRILNISTIYVTKRAEIFTSGRDLLKVFFFIRETSTNIIAS